MRNLTTTSLLLAMCLPALCLALIGCGSTVQLPGEWGPTVEIDLASVMRSMPVEELKPGSSEAAAALHRRGDALLVDGALIYHGASSGLVIYERGAQGVFFKAALHLPGAVTDVAGTNGVLAVSCGAHGLFMVDVLTPSEPEIVVHLRFVGATHRLHWEDEKLTVALGSMGVVLLGMEKPRSPRVLAYWPSEGMVRHAVRVDKTIYVAEGRAGVAVLDYRPGRGLVLDYRLETEGGARALLSREELVFVAEGTAGISILRENDGGLERVASLSVGDTARDVFLDGERLLTALGDRGVAVIDVSDPAAPGIVARFDNDRPINRVRSAGDLVYLGNDSSGLVILRESQSAAGEFEQIYPAVEAEP